MYMFAIEIIGSLNASSLTGLDYCTGILTGLFSHFMHFKNILTRSWGQCMLM